MKNTFTTSRPVALLAVLLLASAAVAAAQPARRAPQGPPHGFDGPGFFLLERMAEKLDLSASQIAEIEELMESHRIDTAGLLAEAQAAHGDVRTLAESGVFDEAAIRAAAQKAAGLHVELTVERARLKSTIHNVLTPEQQEKAAEIKEERPARQFRGRHGPGRGRAPRAWR